MAKQLPSSFLFILIAFVFCSPVLAAPQPEVDGIAAIVNKNVILKSEVDDQVVAYSRELQVDLSDSTKVAQLRKEILESMIEERLIVDEADKTGITLTKTELKDALDEAMANTKARIGSPEQFKAELERQGITEDELRAKYEVEVRKQLLLMKMIGKEVQSKVKITDGDVADYFKKKKAELPKKSEEVKLSHIFIKVRPDSAALSAARTKGNLILERLKKGEKFESVAESSSDDPSAKYGGDLGFFSRGELDPEFERVAFSLGEGQTSGLVETRFGIHIIKVEKKDDNKVRARHILIRVEPQDKDRRDARALAVSVRKRILAGEDFAVLCKQYSDETETADKGGDLGLVEVNNLPPDIKEAVAPLSPGEVTEPVEDNEGYHLFEVNDRIDEREFTYAEIKDQLKEVLRQEKTKEGYEKWVEAIRKKSYIERRTW